MKRTITMAAMFAFAGTALAQTGTIITYADQDSFGDAGPTLGFGYTATVQPAGIRAAPNGARFFNIEGSANGQFASWGGLDVDKTEVQDALDQLAIDAGFAAGDWTITAVTLSLTQANSGFTRNGGVELLYTADDSANFDPRSGNLSRYTFPNIPFVTVPVTSWTFTQTSSGDVNTYDIGTTEVLADLNDQGDTQLTLILNPTDAGVAATYKGQDSPFAGSNAPYLTLTYKLGGAGCPADFNGDGAVDSDDFFDFLNAYNAGDPSADFNGDGAVDSDDFFDFLNAYNTGC